MSKQRIVRRLLVASVILVVVAALVPPTPARAAPVTWTVDSLGDAAVGVPANCTDLVTGNCRLRDALEAASSEDQIYFSVTGTITLTGGALSIISKNLTIEGPGVTQLTIDGNNAGRIFWIYNSRLSLHTMRLSHGLVNNANSPATEIGGGALLIAGDSDVTLGGLVIDHNTVDCNPCGAGENNGLNGHGGAIVVIGNSSLSVSTSTISNNSATWFGGGISFNSGTGPGIHLVLTNVALTGNQAAGALMGYGGGLSIGFADTAELTRVKISDNTASTAGGGMFAYDASISIDDSLIELNDALGTDSSSGGGGIKLDRYASLTLTDSTFDGNTATGKGGGGLLVYQGSAMVANSTFHANWAKGTAAGQGGGGVLLTNAGGLTLMNDTIANNHASSMHGGALYRASGTLSSKNTILSDSFSSSDCFDSAGTAWTSSANNLIEANDPAALCPSTGEWDGLDPKLGPLQDNGGPTKTMTLLDGSPAIDVGNKVDCEASPVNNLDQRGELRGGDGNGDGNALCDLGAVELVIIATVHIGGTLEGRYYIPAGGRLTPRYSWQQGPVQVKAVLPIFTSQRVHNVNGFINEALGIPTGELTTEYWFPWYDNLGMTSWILVGNPHPTATAHVTINIAGTDYGPYELLGGQVTARQYSVMDGPVHITSDLNVFASERVATGQGFVQETMGYPNNQLSNEYWFPWYDNLGMISWILVGNPSPDTDAHVTIKIAGTDYGPYNIPHGGRIAQQFGVMDGPVHITSDINVFASERVHGINGFVQETMGYPNEKLSTEYWFPWYDNLGMISWILVGNPGTSQDAHVTISIGGTNYGPYTVTHGMSITPQFGVMNGPVRIMSDIKVFASERVHTGQGFVQETMGLANNRLTTEYWYPWYDDVTMMNWVLMGRP